MEMGNQSSFVLASFLLFGLSKTSLVGILPLYRLSEGENLILKSVAVYPSINKIDLYNISVMLPMKAALMFLRNILPIFLLFWALRSGSPIQ